MRPLTADDFEIIPVAEGENGAGGYILYLKNQPSDGKMHGWWYHSEEVAREAIKEKIYCHENN